MQSQYFDDFDTYSSAVRDVDSVMMLQNPTHLGWSLNYVALHGIDVQLASEGSGKIIEGRTWSNGYLLYITLTDSCKCLINGTVLDRNSFAILEPGCDVCISTKDKHDWCSIFVPTDKLTRSNDVVEASSGSEKSACRLTYPNCQLAEQFRAFVRLIVTAATNCLEFESTPAAKCATGELLKVSSLLVGQRQGGEPGLQGGRPRLSRQEIIRRSQDLLEERDGEPVLVGELAAATGVSIRTLRTAFKEYYGVGPFRYLQLRQLHQVRSALRSAEPEAVQVSDILVTYGVWEFSRFASRYRRLFGELPSETLRRRR